ncbi:MAG: peptidoglycan DD-metalloendopeptidase family protein [Amphritea sp.]
MQLTVRQYSAQAALLAVTLLLSACGGSSIYTPVSERSIGAKTPVRVVSSAQKLPSVYEVRRGDTLYSIAFRYGLDYRQLAQRNRINNSFSIYPGQKLRLTGSVASSSQRVSSSSKSVSPASTPAVASNTQKKTYTQAKTQAKPAVNQTKHSATRKASATQQKTAVSNTRLAWRWPAQGRVIQGYSNGSKVNKGINLSGNRGDPVYAAESGRVVYAGSGLLGYGNLVIINHNQQYLSAYAHNSRILVKENDMVKLGAKIAEIGHSGTTRDMLHFEIRRDGRPVDPMKYLPRKR